MPSETIPITVDATVAQRYSSASPEERRKVDLLLQLRLREILLSHARPLREIMDEVGLAADAQGLTSIELETLHPFHGIPIVTPQSFLDLTDENDAGSKLC